jgi:hypothetical protein
MSIRDTYYTATNQLEARLFEKLEPLRFGKFKFSTMRSGRSRSPSLARNIASA